MGSSWSSAVAQDVMLSQVEAVGLDARHLLADDKAAPNGNEVDEFCAVCTDDVMHCSRSVDKSCDRLAKLDVQCGRSGIVRKPVKDLDWSLRGTAIGCNFDGKTGFLDPSASKQIQIFYDTFIILSSIQAKPDDVMTINGSLQWFDLLARSKLSVYCNVYNFEWFADAALARRLPPEVRSELQLNIALSLFWLANLDRPFLPMVSATDASARHRPASRLLSAEFAERPQTRKAYRDVFLSLRLAVEARSLVLICASARCSALC